jgi:hypothetical protein
VTAQILLPVTNTGGVWISLDEFDSQWTAYDPSGAITETGRFDAAAPKLLAPTGESFLVAEWFGDEHNAGDFASVEADGYFTDAEMPDGLLIPSNVTTRKHDFGGVEVVGELENTGQSTVDNADVVALFFDDSGNVLGFASGYAENIAPGGTRTFQIDSSFAEIKLADIAETRVFASPWDF